MKLWWPKNKSLYETWVKFFVPILASLSPSTACQEQAYIKNCYSATYQQAWIMKENSGQEGGDAGSSMVFCTTAPTTVRNILTRVKSNEDGAASNKPSFHICYRSHHRMKVDILMPAKGLDCRLSIRTCKETIKDIKCRYKIFSKPSRSQSSSLCEWMRERRGLGSPG